jgi:hypothetical protein
MHAPVAGHCEKAGEHVSQAIEIWNLSNGQSNMQKNAIGRAAAHTYDVAQVNWLKRSIQLCRYTVRGGIKSTA